MLPTTATTNEIKRHLRETVALMKTLRDELRVELHLAGMDARDRFEAFRTNHHPGDETLRR